MTAKVVMVLAVCTGMLMGCSSQPAYSTGVVEGIVTVDGKPLPEVSVVFSPDNAKHNSGPAAGALTDQDGHYRLTYVIPNDRDPAAATASDGALVGWHTVTVSDFRMTNELLPPPGRVPSRYINAATSPLSVEVFLGTQIINLELNSRGAK